MIKYKKNSNEEKIIATTNKQSKITYDFGYNDSVNGSSGVVENTPICEKFGELDSDISDVNHELTDVKDELNDYEKHLDDNDVSSLISDDTDLNNAKDFTSLSTVITNINNKTSSITRNKYDVRGALVNNNGVLSNINTSYTCERSDVVLHSHFIGEQTSSNETVGVIATVAGVHSLYDGMRVRILFANGLYSTLSNTSYITMNVNSLGSKSIVYLKSDGQYQQLRMYSGVDNSPLFMPIWAGAINTSASNPTSENYSMYTKVNTTYYNLNSSQLLIAINRGQILDFIYHDGYWVLLPNQILALTKFYTKSPFYGTASDGSTYKCIGYAWANTNGIREWSLLYPTTRYFNKVSSTSDSDLFFKKPCGGGNRVLWRERKSYGVGTNATSSRYHLCSCMYNYSSATPTSALPCIYRADGASSYWFKVSVSYTTSNGALITERSMMS